MIQLIEKIFRQPIEDFFNIVEKFLPTLLSSVLIFVFGFIIAWIIRIILGKLAGLLRIDRFFRNAGIVAILEKMGITKSPMKILRHLIYWTIVFIFTVIALISLNVPAMENLLTRFFVYLPNVFIAALLLIIGYLVANFVGRLVLITQVNAGVKNAGFFSRAVKYIIIIFAVTMALEHLGIGRETVLIAFTVTFGGIILALAIALGLGGKDIAKDFLEKKFKGTPKEKDDFKHF